jgi:hypothetical protein
MDIKTIKNYKKIKKLELELNEAINSNRLLKIKLLKFKKEFDKVKNEFFTNENKNDK